VSDEINVGVKTTLKGQGGNDPWTTVGALTDEEFRNRLLPFLPEDLDSADIEVMSTPTIVAEAAKEYVARLNATPGISIQRDRVAAAPATPAASASPAAGGSRPPLSTSLSVEDDGNYWITLPYQRVRALGDKQREYAKQLGARYKPDDCPASVPRNAKGAPERPWCVHQRFVSEENVAELLRLHETGFAEIK
jgi:hypothetical protein